jgi:hypothetical protein
MMHHEKIVLTRFIFDLEVIHQVLGVKVSAIKHISIKSKRVIMNKGEDWRFGRLDIGRFDEGPSPIPLFILFLSLIKTLTFL